MNSELLRFWEPLYSQTMERLDWFKAGFREYYTEEQLADEKLESSIVYGLSKHGGQCMLYDVWSMTKRCVGKGTFLKLYTSFVNAFDVIPETKAKLTPETFIDLFFDYMYSRVLKREFPKDE